MLFYVILYFSILFYVILITWGGQAQTKAVVEDIYVSFHFGHFQDEVDFANEEGDCNKESHEDQHRVGRVVLQQHCPDYRNLCSAQVKILDCLGDEVALVNILILLSDWEAMIIS